MNQFLPQALLYIAEHFGMYSVVEAAETEVAVQLLASVGIDCLQGFYFGRRTAPPPFGRLIQIKLKAFDEDMSPKP